jgi:hypothetical protein
VWVWTVYVCLRIGPAALTFVNTIVELGFYKTSGIL